MVILPLLTEINALVTREPDLASYILVGARTEAADPAYTSIIGSCCNCTAAVKKDLPPNICGFDGSQGLLLASIRFITNDNTITLNRKLNKN